MKFVLVFALLFCVKFSMSQSLTEEQSNKIHAIAGSIGAILDSATIIVHDIVGVTIDDHKLYKQIAYIFDKNSEHPYYFLQIDAVSFRRANRCMFIFTDGTWADGSKIIDFTVLKK